MQRAGLAAGLLTVLLLAGSLPVEAELPSAEAAYLPSAADTSVAALLVQARSALAGLAGRDGELAAVDRDSAYNGAIDALTGLYQLHGCRWALPRLLELRRQPDCPDTHIGWSCDGRVALMLQGMELSNPAYDDYTLLLCTLTSNTALNLEGPLKQPLRILLLDGSGVSAQPLNEQHPLWPQLRKLDGSFEPQGALRPVSGLVFKQIFALRNLTADRIARVESDWGEYRITVNYLENAAP